MTEEKSFKNMSFEQLYQCVQPIVFKCRRTYHIQLWELSDWHQEGMICLFHLIQNNPCCLENSSLLFTYFKTKFSSYLKDVLRSQESDKRRLNRMPYEEVSELSHYIPNKGLNLEESIILKEQLSILRKQLPEEEHHLIDLLISGKRFKGRSLLLRQLKELSQ